MIPDRVIVTIQSADGKFHGDYELPANVPVKMFKEQLISGLALLAPQAFEPCRILGAGLFVKNRESWRGFRMRILWRPTASGTAAL